jgi:hypothetical protein
MAASGIAVGATDAGAGLRQQIEESFRQATAHQQNLRRKQQRFSLTHTALSGITGLTAGVPAATGVLPGDNWRIVCALAALAAFAATIVGVLQRQATDADILADASECVGKLRELRVDLASPAPDLAEIGGRYRQVLAAHDSIVS